MAEPAESLYPSSLLIASFRQWAADYEALPVFGEGAILLFDLSGTLLCGHGQTSPVFENQLLKCVKNTVRTGEPAEEAAESGMLLRAIPVADRSEGTPIATLVFCIPVGADLEGRRAMLYACVLDFRNRLYFHFEEGLLRQAMLSQCAHDREAERKDALFIAAKRLHDQIDVPSVLKETIQSLESLYPDSAVDLLLSQDYASVDARVKPLVIKNAASDISARAFLEGKMVKEKGEDGVRLAVPLSGKQAVYGVLLMTVPAEQWEESDLSAFIMLADTAGSAFENAKLYEQSNVLIGELQLINELTKRLNQSLRLSEIFQFATSELLQVFHADFCCVLQLNKEISRFVVMSSNIPALAGEQFSTEYGFSGMVYRSKESLIISDYHAAGQVASKLMDMTASRSLIASPIMVGNDVGGVIMVAHRNAHYFSYDNYKLLQVLSTHIGLAITNASLHAEVRRMVITDNLTSLHARHYLNEQIQLRQRKDPCGSLILVDIDYFKKVNDTYGHQIGDRILVQVSNVITSCIRDSDIAARWGGEELAVYLPQVRTEQAYRIADRIRTRVEAETDPKVTASCGVSEWTFEDEKISPESLFYRADMALYEAKHHGRNQVFVG
ncbi:diguanylate cyclase [Paenibacillus darwinianus]|uniref:Diguanylate cyclase n=1 Tax=Paenibacillus darwinianus TaxID=1380763 RepID=A0A9W5S0U1_9BACL|nr:diguanylate cyclase [Paenibacillus darwinianus]EXX88078.1 diguanylate cyclase [Paenibacillus darwinianus]EXX88333.1 diguanylate cyclase [Paenibacillus darwinianus]EXX89938.1 diguanylate cyclase [Paenibacillus darwinianus]